MREHLLAAVLAGHDIGFNADVNIFNVYKDDVVRYQVELYDPRDDDTGEPMHDTFIGYKGLNFFERTKDIWHLEFATPEEAIAMYLDVVEWLTRSNKP